MFNPNKLEKGSDGNEEKLEEPKTAEWILIKNTLKAKKIDINKNLIDFYNYYTNEEVKEHLSAAEGAEKKLLLQEDLKRKSSKNNGQLNGKTVSELFMAGVISKKDFEDYKMSSETSKRLNKKKNPFNVLKEIVEPKTKEIQNKINKIKNEFLLKDLNKEESILNDYDQKLMVLEAIDLGSLNINDYIELIDRSVSDFKSRIKNRRRY